MEFEPQAPPTGETTPPANPSEALVGEGKPFKDINALAKGKLEADTFIEQLKAENSQMLAKLTKAEQESLQGGTINSVLEAVRQLSGSGTPNDPAPPGEGNEAGNQSSLNEEDVASVVAKLLQKNETVKTQANNFDTVRNAFQKQYNDPDKARLQYKAAAESLGMTEEQLDEFSKMNPKLVLRAAGLEQAFKSNQTPPSYLSGDKPGDSGEGAIIDTAKDNTWWEEQRKAKGNAWYFRPKVQQAYWKDVKALGDNFLKD